jgi:hypothetical protein
MLLRLLVKLNDRVHMELLNVGMARSVWLFDQRDINPRGKYIEAGFIEWLKSLYHFSKYPSSLYDRDESGGMSFEAGGFQVRESQFVTVHLKVYTDGLVAETRSSTHDTDTFIEDVLRLAVQDLDLIYDPGLIRQKLYVSDLHVRVEASLNQLNPGMNAFTRKLATLRGGDPPLNFELSSLRLSPDVLPPTMITPFLFERQENTMPSEHRYFSRAPLHTDDHFKLLEEFETILVG